MSRANKFLAILMLVQLGFVWLVHRTEVKAEGTIEVYSDLTEVDQITSLLVEDGKNSVRLTQIDSVWVLPEAGNVEAAQTKANSLLETLVQLKLDHPIATKATSHGRLNVSETVFTRKLTLNDDRVVYLGRSSEGYGAMYLRKHGENEVYRVEGFVEYDWMTRNSSWVESTIIDKRSGDFRDFMLENDKGRHAFHKDSDDKWAIEGPAIEGKQFDDTQFGIWINQQGSWMLADVIGLKAEPEYGFETPTAKLTFVVETKVMVEDPNGESDDDGKKPMVEQFKHEVKVLTIGAKRPSGNDWYATFTGDKRIFTIPDHRMKDLTRDRDSFFKDVEKALE